MSGLGEVGGKLLLCANLTETNPPWSVSIELAVPYTGPSNTEGPRSSIRRRHVRQEDLRFESENWADGQVVTKQSIGVGEAMSETLVRVVVSLDNGLDVSTILMLRGRSSMWVGWT